MTTADRKNQSPSTCTTHPYFSFRAQKTTHGKRGRGEYDAVLRAVGGEAAFDVLDVLVPDGRRNVDARAAIDEDRERGVGERGCEERSEGVVGRGRELAAAQRVREAHAGGAAVQDGRDGLGEARVACEPEPGQGA
eukprot:656741-Rhodomonas_salina.3